MPGTAKNWEAGNSGFKDGGVNLWVRSLDVTPLAGIRCDVQDPQGHIYGDRPDFDTTPGGRVDLLFPDAFDGVPDPPTPGGYNVVWRTGPGKLVLDRDDFQWPEPPRKEPLADTINRAARSKADQLAGRTTEPVADPPALSPGPWLSGGEEKDEAWTRHRLNGGVIELSIRNLPGFGPFDSLVCTVEPEEGEALAAPADITVGGSALVEFPFKRPANLPDGRYVVRWRKRSLLLAGPMLVARDVFVIKGGRLVR
jgi:hypothetical protein